LERGGITCIVGPNGSGKTAFLNLLGFIRPPRCGTVFFDGAPVDFRNARQVLRLRRRVGYLMQSPYLFNMRVQDNIGYGLRVRGVGKADIQRRVGAVMERLSLSHLAGRGAHKLSGGEAQRVALARTFVLDTDIYLLDEPTANVDRRHVGHVETLINELNVERGATIVLTTHSQEQAYRLSRNLLSILDGRIRGARYENVFAGTVRLESDGLAKVYVSENVAFLLKGGRPGSNITIAIDPEAVILSGEELESSALNRFEGRITRMEEVNGGVRVFVDVGVSLCALVTRCSVQRMSLTVGSSVWATFKASAVEVL
jgi:molybdopterin-binding protein